jgi:diaminopimelate decarboxylase
VPVTELAARFGTPLYVFDATALRQRVAAVQQALGPRVRLLWSIKANPSVAVTRVLRTAGTGAELASIGELQVALAAGHAPAALRFAGPGKTDAELAAALAAGVGCFHVESAQELDALARLAAGRERATAVALRVNLPHELGGSRMRMGGRSSRFGVDAEQVPALAKQVLASPQLTLAGLHVYGGTQVFDANAFVAHAERLCELAADWERTLGAPLPELDLGGGFGVATYQGDPEFDLAAAGRGLQQLLARFDRPDRTWFVELGRYLAAPAGIYLTRVVRTKTSGGEAHAVVDGGLHQHAAAAGVGTVVRRPPLLERAEPGPTGDAGDQPVTIGGPLCTPADQFAASLPLGPLHPGDLLVLRHSGAYGLSYSPHGFLSHPTPAEVMVDAGTARVVRRRGEPADVLRGQQADGDVL